MRGWLRKPEQFKNQKKKLTQKSIEDWVNTFFLHTTNLRSNLGAGFPVDGDGRLAVVAQHAVTIRLATRDTDRWMEK